MPLETLPRNSSSQYIYYYSLFSLLLFPFQFVYFPRSLFSGIHKESIVMKENNISFQYFNEVNFTWETATASIAISSRTQLQECFQNLKLFALVDSYEHMYVHCF